MHFAPAPGIKCLRRITLSLLAVHYFADSIKQIRAAGSNPGLHFYVMTPPRFSTQREVLYKMAVEMKRNGIITRFSFLVKRNALCLKVSAPGQSDRVIDCPLELSANDAQMEVDTGNEELDPSCPICLAPYGYPTDIYLHMWSRFPHEVSPLLSFPNLKIPLLQDNSRDSKSFHGKL